MVGCPSILEYRIQRCSIDLGNYFIWVTISTSVPTSGNLSSNSTAELEGLASTFLILDEPLAIIASPDIAMIPMLVLELRGFCFSDFNRFQVMNKFDLLIEKFFVGIIATEQFRFCKVSIVSIKKHEVNQTYQ